MKKHLLMMILSAMFSGATAQNFASVNGTVMDSVSRVPLSYVNIALYNPVDSKLIQGQVSDTAGRFRFTELEPGKYNLIVSLIGYDKKEQLVQLEESQSYNADVIYLSERITSLRDAVIKAERQKGTSERDKTVFYVTRKMTESSTNGLDIVRLVPGVQLDIRRRISLEGSSNILILVNGIERDNSYVSQIAPESIDRVEIMSAPPAKYDATVTGVINIILKEKKSGSGGRLNFEIPFTSSVFAHPDYNLNFVYKKLNFFTSYNGEWIHFNQDENLDRFYRSATETITIKTEQHVTQKYRSHRFDYGFDFSAGQKLQISFYGYTNPSLQVYQGNSETTGSYYDNPWKAVRASTNKNTSYFNSLFIKHLFDQKGSNIEGEISQFWFSGENSSEFISPERDITNASIYNYNKPRVNSWNLRTDAIFVFKQGCNLGAGLKLKFQEMTDQTITEFDFDEKIFAGYASYTVNRSHYDWNMGLRMENSETELKNIFHTSGLIFLPYAALSLKLDKERSIKLVISRTISRPNLYQLNPALNYDVPFSVRAGNPSLKPEIHTSAFAEYSQKMKSNFLSVRFFYNRITEVISNLTYINDSSIFETRMNNLGSIDQFGFQFSGTFKAGRFNLVPFFRIYANCSNANLMAERRMVSDKKQMVIEPGISSIFSFNHDMNLIATFQYSSPRNSIEWNSMSDAMYTMALDKNFKSHFKVSVVTVLPLTRSFTYQGSQAREAYFKGSYKGEIHLPELMISLKLSYQFQSGKSQEKVNRQIDNSDELPKRGL